MRRPVVLLAGLLALSACTSSPPAEEPRPTQAAESPEPAPSESAEEVALSDEAAALIAETEGSDAPPAPGTTPTKKANDEGAKGHDLVYRVKPDELRIEVLAAAFVPTVKAVRVRGGWGVEISVEASTTQELSLLSSDTGPLALAATVRGKTEDHSGDVRSSGKDVLLLPGKSQSFRRIWPGPDEKPLGPGQELVLQVGLWGLGPTPETRKPARRFFEVKLTVNSKGAIAFAQPPK